MTVEPVVVMPLILSKKALARPMSGTTSKNGKVPNMAIDSQMLVVMTKACRTLKCSFCAWVDIAMALPRNAVKPALIIKPRHVDRPAKKSNAAGISMVAARMTSNTPVTNAIGRRSMVPVPPSNTTRRVLP